MKYPVVLCVFDCTTDAGHVSVRRVNELTFSNANRPAVVFFITQPYFRILNLGALPFMLLLGTLLREVMDKA